MRNNNPGRRAVKKDAKVTGSRIEQNKHPIIVVGVGTSAGGLKSLNQLFAKMPTGHGVAFVLVRHLKTKRKSLTVKLLANQTSLAVVEATDGMPLLADRIHVIPPDKYLNINNNILTIREPVLCNNLRMPIDHFFCSLALDQRGRSVGILLSGKGSDGILGLSEIKSVGGKTLVEEPGNTKYPGMLQSAIDTGVADTVLPVKDMAEAITALMAKVTAGTRSAQTYPPEFDEDVRTILDILRAKVGHDFLCYKPNTIIRRIRRRMGLAKIATFADYAQFLHEHTKEVGLLQKDLLIGVTDFFRQPQAWETLEEKIITPLVDNAQPGAEIRVWVPGCSTGQEAYSLAMMLTEHVEKSGKKLTVQIFATDSDLTSLATARSGIYSKEDIGENVSSRRLKRFFLRKDGHYQVVKDIREQVVFAPQNITADPPFSRLDLISCRNLLIYLDQEVQKKIIALFHFSLRDGGFLFLGTAETVGDREELFEPVSKKWRIYRRIGVGRRVGVEIPSRPTVTSPPATFGGPARAAAKAPLVTPPSRMSLASGAQHMLLDRFAPACVMIDRKLQVLYVHGAVTDYLTFPPGELTTRVVDMAREGLRARLRGAIAKCLQSNKSVSVTARVRRGSKSVAVKTVVSPLRYPREIDGLLLITFEDYRIPIAKTSRDVAATGDVRHLEDELKITREELQSTIEQLENSNDELKASNEEVTAANEELQSANEEMETSKEELQSLNEELNTINVRLHDKVDELEGVNNDVVNLLSSTSIATVFLDKELKVKRYTPAITRLLSLIPTDTGRPFADILRRFTDETLLDDACRVLANLTPLSNEVQGDDGRWYIRRITPYRTQDDRIEGVVVTFVDIDALKEAEEALRQLNAELEERVAEQTGELRTASLYSRSLIEAGLDPLVTISPEGRITDVNEATEQVTGRTRRELIGTDFSDYFTEPDAAQMGYRKVFADGQVRDYPLTIRHASGSTIDVLYNASIYRNEAGDVQGVFAAARDVTELKQAEAALREANETLEQRVAERTAEIKASEGRYRELVQNANSAIIRWKSDGTLTFFNEYAQNFFGYSADEILGKHVGILLPNHESTGGDLTGLVQEIVNDPERYVNNINENICRDGRRVWMTWTNRPILGENGRVSEILAVGTDITKRKQAEDALSEARHRLAMIVDSIADGFYALDREWRFTHVNDAALRHMGKTREEIIGHSLSEIFPTVRGSVTETQYRHAMESGAPVHFESPSVIADVMLEIHAYPGPENLTVLFRDITEKHRMAAELRKSEATLRGILNASKESIWLFSSGGVILKGNETALRRFGKSAEEVSGKHFTEILPAELAQSRLEHLKEAVESGQPVEFEDERAGISFLHSFYPVLEADGRVTSVASFSRDITERKQAEARNVQLLNSVQEEKDRLSALVNSISDEVWFADTQKTFTLMNPSAIKEFSLGAGDGVSVEKLAESLEVYRPDGSLRPVEEAPPLRALGGEVVSNQEEIIRTPASGKLLYRQVSAAPVRDASGAIIGSVSVVRDITERKRAEEALQTTLQHLHALVANMHSSILLVGEDRIELANQAFCNYFDLQESPADLIGLSPRELIGKIKNAYLQPEGALIRIQEILSRGEPVIGEEIPMQGGRTCLRDFIPIHVNGRSYGRLWSHADITARKQAEDALRESEDKFSKAFQTSPFAITITRMEDGKFVDVNDAFTSMTGFTREDALASSSIELDLWLDNEDRQHVVAEIRAGRSVEGQEYKFRTKNGKVMIGLFSAQVIQLSQELCVLSSINDITERKRAEEVLKERTAELEAINKELESFSYSVSHDLRAPLRAIDGYARSILKKQEDKFDEDTKRRFNDIRLNARMMGQLIDDLLAFSRLGKKHMSISKLDMDAVITDVWKELQTANPERDMKLTLKSMPSGYGDRTLIKQVCSNLISNAVKFTKLRHPAHIEAGGCTEGNEDVFYIKDNGVGFDMAYYDKLFGVFQRLHNPDDFEGTGVGLATVQRIIHRHEGRVWAEGKVNEGATFYFSLPRKG